MHSDEDEAGYMDCEFDSERAREQVCSTCTWSEAEDDSDAMNRGKQRRSKSLERLSNFSVHSPAGEANVLTSSQSHQEIARRPRIPPRPSTQLLSKFRQQRDVLASRPPGASQRSPEKVGNPVRTMKYVELDVLPSKENPKGVRKGGAGRTAGSPQLSKSRTAPRTSYAMLQLPDESSNSPTSSIRRTSGQPPHSGSRRSVQRSKSNAHDQARHSEYKTPRNSTAYPAASDSWERLSHLETETPSPRKPRKTSSTVTLHPTAHRSPPLPPRGLTVDHSACTSSPVPEPAHHDLHTTSPHIIDLRTGTATYNDGSKSPHTSAGEASASTTSHTSAATAHLNGHTAPHRHSSHEPHSTSSPSDIATCNTARREESTISHEKSQFGRPPPPSRKPPDRPPGPIPRPRKARTSVTAVTTSPNEPESDQYMRMVSAPRVSSTASGTSSSVKPSLSSCGVVNMTPLPRVSGGTREGGGVEGVREAQGDTADVSDEFDGAYSYVDLVKDRRLMVTSNSTVRKTSTRREGELQVTSVDYKRLI